MKLLAVALVCGVLLPSSLCCAQSAVYLSCDIPSSPDGKTKGEHFELSLSELNGVVTFLDTVSLTQYKAFFGPDAVTWMDSSEYGSVTRTVNRVTLAYTQTSTLRIKPKAGQCAVVATPERKF